MRALACLFAGLSATPVEARDKAGMRNLERLR
jgi:hypothetical protein